MPTKAELEKEINSLKRENERLKECNKVNIDLWKNTNQLLREVCFCVGFSYDNYEDGITKDQVREVKQRIRHYVDLVSRDTKLNKQIKNLLTITEEQAKLIKELMT